MPTRPTHTSETAYTRGTYSRVHTQTHNGHVQVRVPIRLGARGEESKDQFARAHPRSMCSCSVVGSCVLLLLFTGAAEAALLLPHATPDRTLFERLHDPRLVPTSEAQAMPVVRLPGYLLHLLRWLHLPHLLHHLLACCTY